MKRTYVTMEREGKIYKVYPCSLGLGLIEVNVYRVNPKAKIFKHKYVGSKCFDLDEAESLEEGCINCFNKVYQDIVTEESRYRKWKEFERGC